MEHEPKKGFMREAVIGSIIVAVIFVVGTFWMGNSVSRDTENAVRNVSLLYLDELAGRREQVVESALAEYTHNMNIALGLIEKDDLSDVEHLQAYQTRMKQLYGLEKFAFVTSDGLIYTSMGTRNDIEIYDFDYKNMTDSKTFIKNLHEGNKKFVVAIPVDNLPFQGKTLVACFMEISINSLLNYICMQDTGNTTFCNLYTTDGTALTNVILGGLSSGHNIFDELAYANLKHGYTVDKLKEDFKNARKGYVSFNYDNVKGIFYYVPVHGTDWMLTYLIRESVVSDQINSITEGIISRTLTQSILAALVLISIFTLMIIQMRKNTKIRLEQQTAETENRVKQQELEEQLALQEELLAQEQYRAQQDNMINALAVDYRSVYYVNLVEDEGICYRKDESMKTKTVESEHFPFRETFEEYANTYVTEDYREDFLNFVEVKNIREALKKSPVIIFRYLINRDNKESYEMIRIANVKVSENQSDAKINNVCIGITDIDAEMRDSLEKNQALSDALKTAEEASKAKTVFLSSMSHEIRTPMNAIIGLGSLALHEPGISKTTKEYLEKIGTSAQHLLSLINDILDMSRIESGRMVIKNEEFAFSKLIEQINTIFSGQCNEKNLNYNCQINGNIGDYYIGDSVKLRQVLINILGNAVKFTPSGGNIDFIVEETAKFDGKSTIKFVVKDTGIGMDKEFLPKIFDAFSQEDSTVKNKYGSTGLGMAITKSIVEMMNGKISVESEKGVGSTFTVVVTLKASDKKLNDEVEQTRLQDMSVLVIDDDPIACDHAKLVLGNAGINTEIANSGKQALEMIQLRQARREPYNLIVVDWQMPEMDGLETTRRIRSMINDDVAIIILTAYNWEDIMDEAVAAGVDSFISKPLFSSNLLEEFNKAVKSKTKSLPEQKQKAELEGRKILLAEDMPVNAEIIMMVLEMRGIEPELAENGRIALEKFEKSPVGYYDAILMDMRMPEMDGLQATEKIRALDRPDAKTIPIIALTANAFDEDVQRSLQAGLNAHLSKPVEPEVLFETLENMIPA